MQKAKQDVIDRQRLAQRLFSLGKKVLAKKQIEMRMQEEINAVKESYSDRLERRTDTIEQMANELRLECEDSREELLTGRKKSVETLFGRVGWRKQGRRLKTQKGVKTDEVADRLKENGHGDLIRTVEKPDKRAIKSALKEGRLTVDQLKRMGLILRGGGEDWWYEIDEEHVREEMEES